MKIFRYLIFFSILSGIFFVIYRQSDEKGFRRWWISFKIAVLIAASAAGLIPANTEAMEPPGNNNQVYQERLFSDQEFNSFEDNDQKVILAKTDDSAPSVPTSTGRGQPSNFSTPPSGGRPSRNLPGVNPYPVAPKIVDQQSQEREIVYRIKKNPALIREAERMGKEAVSTFPAK